MSNLMNYKNKWEKHNGIDEGALVIASCGIIRKNIARVFENPQNG